VKGFLPCEIVRGRFHQGYSNSLAVRKVMMKRIDSEEANLF